MSRSTGAAQAGCCAGGARARWKLRYGANTSPARGASARGVSAIAAVASAWSPLSGATGYRFRRSPAQLARYRDAGIAYASAPAPENPLELDSDALKSCTNGLSLRIESDNDGRGSGPVYRVDLMNPCWVFPQVDLDRVARIGVRAGHIPYYFQLWHDDAKVVTRKSTSGVDELQLRLDDCNGPVAATSPLRTEHAELESIDVAMPAVHGVHDVCFAFATRARDPLWLIDLVQLMAK